jgi:TonB family protein
MPWPKPRPSPRLRLAAFLGALAAHLAVVYAIAHQMPDDSIAGGQGSLLDAVNITMVSSKVFEARQDADAPRVPVAAAAVEAKEGSVESEPALQQPEQKDENKEPEKAEEPPPPVQGVEAPAAVEAPQEKKSERKEASTPADAGGATARGDALLDEKQSAPAAASPGAVREYARYVIQALAKVKPRRSLPLGTVRIRLQISPDGEIASLAVIKSSGNKKLDDAALVEVRRARFPRPPVGMTDKQRLYDFAFNSIR